MLWLGDSDTFLINKAEPFAPHFMLLFDFDFFKYIISFPQLLMKLPRRKSRTSLPNMIAHCWSQTQDAVRPRNLVDLGLVLVTRNHTVNCYIAFCYVKIKH